jgi:hypothetical protein
LRLIIINIIKKVKIFLKYGFELINDTIRDKISSQKFNQKNSPQFIADVIDYYLKTVKNKTKFTALE